MNSIIRTAYSCLTGMYPRSEAFKLMVKVKGFVSEPAHNAISPQQQGDDDGSCQWQKDGCR